MRRKGSDLDLRIVAEGLGSCGGKGSKWEGCARKRAQSDWEKGLGVRNLWSVVVDGEQSKVRTSP